MTSIAQQQDDAKSASTETNFGALSRMIQYVSAEAKQGGFALTGHLLDLADWTLREAHSGAAKATSPRQSIHRSS
jgi:hypothetical protein